MSRDLNDLAVANQLPRQLKDMCSPVNEAARKWDEEHPRVLNVQEMLISAHSRALRKEKSKALTTTNWKLDYLTGGLRPGHVWVLAGDTSIGKTSLLIAIADTNMDKGARMLIVSLEDDESMYADRLLARRSGVSARRLRDKMLKPEEYDAITNVVAKAQPDPMYIDGRGVPLEELVNMVRAAIRANRIDCVFFDYLQEVRASKAYESERVRFRETASALRTMLKREHICGIIASQVTMPEGKKIPDKNCIRESRDVAHGAEAILIGYETEQDVVIDGKVIAKAGDKVIKVDKAKDGMKGVVGMKWNAHSACFDAVHKPHEASDEYQDFIGFQADNDPLPEREDEPIPEDPSEEPLFDGDWRDKY